MSGEYTEEEGEFKRVGELERVCGRRTGFNEDLGFMAGKLKQEKTMYSLKACLLLG